MSTLDFGYGGDAGFTYANLGLLGSDSVSWTFEEDKFFETSLAQYDGSWPITGDDYWGQLQEQMPQKGVHDLKNRFRSWKKTCEISKLVSYSFQTMTMTVITTSPRK